MPVKNNKHLPPLLLPAPEAPASLPKRRNDQIQKMYKVALTLDPLELFPCSVLTGLFTFHDTHITGDAAS
jgi:hypothetical protein